MNENTFCVIWSRERNRLEYAPEEAVLNLNVEAFLHDGPARAVLRRQMTEEQARRFIKAYAPMLAKRSQDRLAQADCMQAEAGLEPR